MYVPNAIKQYWSYNLISQEQVSLISWRLDVWMSNVCGKVPLIIIKKYIGISVYWKMEWLVLYSKLHHALPSQRIRYNKNSHHNTNNYRNTNSNKNSHRNSYLNTNSNKNNHSYLLNCNKSHSLHYQNKNINKN